MKVKVTCENCKNEFEYVKKHFSTWGKRRFCSSKCQREYYKAGKESY